MEVGGKSPLVVCAVADLDTAVQDALMGIFLANGEVCFAASRLLVQAPVYDAFVERFVAGAERLRIGHALDLDTQLGPLITPAHRERVLAHIEAARADGAQPLTGGEALELPGELSGGNFVAPTIFADPGGTSRITREEVFGPVAVVERWEDEYDAIDRANSTEYGLGAGVWTADLERAHRPGGTAPGRRRLGQQVVRHPARVAHGRDQSQRLRARAVRRDAARVQRPQDRQRGPVASPSGSVRIGRSGPRASRLAAMCAPAFGDGEEGLIAARRAQAGVPSPSPFGAEDEIGMLNLITPESRRRVLASVAGRRVFDLSVDFFLGMPSWIANGDMPFQIWMNHTPAGTQVDDAPGVGEAVNQRVSYSGDSIAMYTHCGTHIDALCHWGYGGVIWNGFTEAEQLGSRHWAVAGADRQPPIVARGVLLDIAAALELEELPDSHRIEPTDLEATCRRQGVEVGLGDVVLVRTGRMRRWPDPEGFLAPSPA